MYARVLLFPAVLLLCLLGGLSAQAGQLPPSRVGRVAAIAGAVTMRQAGGDWGDAEINAPVAAGMAVRTGPGARALLRIGNTTLALAPASELELAGLDRRNTNLVLHAGRIGVGVMAGEPARNTEIDLVEGGVWLLSSGDFDITAGTPASPTRIASLAGRARFVGHGLDTVVADGAAAMLNGQSSLAVNWQRADADDFSQWWRQRDDGNAGSPALQYVSPELTGYRALDAGGRWETLDGSGVVWFPAAVPAGWAPYRDGHWRWITPWGWTWIDNADWGFATSHYGRWAWIRGTDQETTRWGWVPGARVADPVYAPALVAFLGTAAIGLSYPDASGPAVAWFPLAPDEVYWPRYVTDLDTIRRINQGSVTDASAIGPAVEGGPPAAVVVGDYQNRRFASVVPRPIFTGGKPVAAALVQLPGERLEDAPLLAGSPSIAPPEPHPVVVAQAPAARRPAVASSRLARAIHTLARIIRRHRPTLFSHAVAAEMPRRWMRPHPRIAVAGHWRVPARAARSHMFAASSGSAHPRPRLAVAHHRVAR